MINVPPAQEELNLHTVLMRDYRRGRLMKLSLNDILKDTERFGVFYK